MFLGLALNDVVGLIEEEGECARCARVLGSTGVSIPVWTVRPLHLTAVVPTHTLCGTLGWRHRRGVAAGRRPRCQKPRDRTQLRPTEAADNFPAPLVRLRTGPVWDRRAIEAYAHATERRPRQRQVTAAG